MARACAVAPKSELAPAYDIEAFDPERLDRTQFASGLDRIDNFLRKSARKFQEGDNARVFAAVEVGSDIVIGFYSLNAHALTGDDLPDALAKRGPRHGVPAVYLSMLGVDRRAQGQGLGAILLADALKRVLFASDAIGVRPVILDVIDDDGADAYARRKAFYEKLGFRSFPSRPKRMFLTIKEIRAAFE